MQGLFEAPAAKRMAGLLFEPVWKQGEKHSGLASLIAKLDTQRQIQRAFSELQFNVSFHIASGRFRKFPNNIASWIAERYGLRGY